MLQIPEEHNALHTGKGYTTNHFWIAIPLYTQQVAIQLQLLCL